MHQFNKSWVFLSVHSTHFPIVSVYHHKYRTINTSNYLSTMKILTLNIKRETYIELFIRAVSFSRHKSIPCRPVLSFIPIRSMYNDLGKTNKEKIQTYWPDLLTFWFLHSFPLCYAILFSLCPQTKKKDVNNSLNNLFRILIMSISN